MNSTTGFNNKLASKVIAIGTVLLLAVTTIFATGCSTTQEFKPTASVMVGAHKSL